MVPVVNVLGLVFDVADKGWSNDETDILNCGGKSEGSSDRVRLDDVRDGAPDGRCVDRIADADQGKRNDLVVALVALVHVHGD